MDISLFLFLGLLGLIVTYLIHAEIYFRELRHASPDVYAALGSPSILGKKQSLLLILKFFASGEYKQIQDTHIVRMGNRLITHFSVVLIAFISFLVLFGQLQ